MSPSRKRRHAASHLDNGTPMPSKRQRAAEIVVLSDNSSDCEQLAHAPETSNNTSRGPVPADTRPGLWPAARSMFEQLRQDEFSDFKADLCLELDSIRPPAATHAGTNAPDGAAAAAAGSNGHPGCHMDGVRDVLRPWLEQDKVARYSNHLYYRLGHNRSRADARNNRLLDREVLETLRGLMNEVPVEVFCALLDGEEGGDAPPSYLVHTLTDLDGRIPVICDIPVAEQNWVQAGPPSRKGGSSLAEVVSV